MDWPLSKNEKVARLLSLYDLDVGQATQQLSAADAALEALVEVIHGSGTMRAAQSTPSRGMASPRCSLASTLEASSFVPPLYSRRPQSCHSAVRISDASTSVGSVEEPLWCHGGSDAASDSAEAERIAEVVRDAAKDIFRVFLEQKSELKWKQASSRAASRRRRRKSCHASLHARRRSRVSVQGTQEIAVEADANKGAATLVEGLSENAEEPPLPSLESFLGIQSVPDFPFPSLLLDGRPPA
mmetsp:Transcript_13424/g.24708  ORF Transcript_13424/g.24708 Transcript_13424/m.24708 type:complete len:242 (-) Transcript_13424:230-955(-)